MGTFGRYLLERGLVSREQLEEATRVLVVFGGRLGTVLVESGALTLEEVEQHLSAHLQVPTAPPERLDRPDPQALAAIPAELVRRHRMFPMWIEKRTLHIAMSDPRDANLIDQLGFQTSLGIRPYAIAERRLVQLLEQHYGIRPDSRFTDYHLLELAGHVRRSWKRRRPERVGDAPKRRATDDDEAERNRHTLGIRPLDEGEELSHDDSDDWAVDATPTAMGTEAVVELTDRVDPPRPPSPPVVCSVAELAELESELVLLAKPQAVPALVLRIATFYVRAAAFLAVRRDAIEVLLAGGEMAGNQVEGLQIPMSADSMLSGPIATGRVLRARPASEGIDRDVLRLLQRNPRELAVLPIRMGQRTVGMLYVENHDGALAETAIAALQALCEITTAAYDRLLLESRKFI